MPEKAIASKAILAARMYYSQKYIIIAR